MTDLELRKACADAMGISVAVQLTPPEYSPGEFGGTGVWIVTPGSVMRGKAYDPLHNDDQAMALVKKHQLEVGWYTDGRAAVHHPNGDANWVSSADLNRAICECVAKIK